MKRYVSAAVAAVFLTVLLGGCATQGFEQHKGATIGGGTGALAGGLLAGAISHSTGGVILGTLLGGLAGAALGNYGFDQKRDESQASRQYGYDYNKAQATLVRIESASVSPKSVKRGGSVQMDVTYTVLGPQGAVMDVVETREVRHAGELQGKPQVSVQRAGGTYTSNVPINLPSDAAKGTYVVATTISSGGSQDTRESTFKVQ